MAQVNRLLSERIAPWIASVLLVVMILRGLIPVGVMPNTDAAAQGAFPLIICTGVGERTIYVKADGTQVPMPDKGEAASVVHLPCAFAGAALALFPLLVLAMLVMAWPRPTRPRPPMAGPSMARLLHHEYPARAPPPSAYATA